MRLIGLIEEEGVESCIAWRWKKKVVNGGERGEV